jgi:DNA-binding transcriptional MerR regulator
MRIGDFARLGNVSVRTLRFYDAIGLLHPLHVDPDSGFRHYGAAQIACLHQIGAFQDLGFSLARIREMLRRDLPAASLRDLMEQRRRELRDHVREDVARLGRIELRLRTLAKNNGGSNGGATPVLVRETKGTWVVSLREKIQCYDKAEDLFEELERKVPARWLAGERVALWHTCEHSGGAIDCEVIRYLKSPIAVPRGLRSYQLPAATIASVFHFGGEDTVPQSYGQLNRWLVQNDFHLQGAKREIYWIEEGNEPLTEIQYPVRRGVARRSRAA